jgi:hypothetical protein
MVRPDSNPPLPQLRREREFRAALAMTLHRPIRKAAHLPLQASVEDAKRLRDAERVEGSLEIRTPMGSTSDFLRSPAHVVAEQRFETPRVLFRFGYFRGMDDEDAAIALAA